MNGLIALGAGIAALTGIGGGIGIGIATGKATEALSLIHIWRLLEKPVEAYWPSQ